MKRLYEVRDKDKKSLSPPLFYENKMEAKQVRDSQHGTLCLGPDHRRFGEAKPSQTKRVVKKGKNRE